MAQISVWYLIPSLNIGGAERTLVDLANNLDHERFDVTIWTIVEGGPLREELDEEVTYECLDADGKADIRAIAAFLRRVRRERPDIIQSFTFFDNQLARLCKLVARDTAVVTGVRTVIDDEPTHRVVLDRFTLPLSDRIISNSEAGAEHIIKRGASPERVEVVRNGRDIDYYANGEATAELYDSLGLDPDAPVVGTVGRLVKRKGHYDLLNAWPAVLEEHSDAHLLLVGDGPQRQGLERRAVELGCSNSVVFAGRRDDIPDLLDAMDVFAFPSHYEGLPGALMEAMIAGVPILATPVDGNVELIDDYETGIIAQTQDIQNISKKIIHLLDDQNLRYKLAGEAEDYSKNHFDMKSMVGRFQRIYIHCIESSSHNPSDG